MIVVDGQQRLTTLYLVMHYIGKLFSEKGAGYGRKILEQFNKVYRLEYANEERQRVFGHVTNALDTITEPSTENIDMYYITSAYKTIKDWCEDAFKIDDEGLRIALSFANKLYHQTTVILYEITAEDGDSGKYFAKINSGKIPLTNSELLKANIMLDEYVLTQNDRTVGIQQTSGMTAGQRGTIVDANEKIRERQLDNERIKIARQWDEVEAVLQDEEFWNFIATDSDKEKYSDTRIDFLFDMIAGEKYNDVSALTGSAMTYEKFCESNKDRASFIILRTEPRPPLPRATHSSHLRVIGVRHGTRSTCIQWPIAILRRTPLNAIRNISTR